MKDVAHRLLEDLERSKDSWAEGGEFITLIIIGIFIKILFF